MTTVPQSPPLVMSVKALKTPFVPTADLASASRLSPKQALELVAPVRDLPSQTQLLKNADEPPSTTPRFLSSVRTLRDGVTQAVRHPSLMFSLLSRNVVGAALPVSAAVILGGQLGWMPKVAAQPTLDMNCPTAVATACAEIETRLNQFPSGEKLENLKRYGHEEITHHEPLLGPWFEGRAMELLRTEVKQEYKPLFQQLVQSIHAAETEYQTAARQFAASKFDAGHAHKAAGDSRIAAVNTVVKSVLDFEATAREILPLKDKLASRPMYPELQGLKLADPQVELFKEIEALAATIKTQIESTSKVPDAAGFEAAVSNLTQRVTRLTNAEDERSGIEAAKFLDEVGQYIPEMSSKQAEFKADLQTLWNELKTELRKAEPSAEQLEKITDKAEALWNAQEKYLVL